MADARELVLARAQPVVAAALAAALEPMSPTCTTKASGLALIASISRVDALDLGLGVGGVAEHAERDAASPAEGRAAASSNGTDQQDGSTQ